MGQLIKVLEIIIGISSVLSAIYIGFYIGKYHGSFKNFFKAIEKKFLKRLKQHDTLPEIISCSAESNGYCYYAKDCKHQIKNIENFIFPVCEIMLNDEYKNKYKID